MRRASAIPVSVAATSVMLCIVLVFVLNRPVEAQQDASCPNAREVDRLGPETTDQSLSFRTTTDRFRVSYEVTFTDDSDESNEFIVEVTDSSGPVKSDTTDVDGSGELIVVENAGQFTVETDVTPNGRATYTVIIEECSDTGGGGGGGTGGGGGGGGGPDGDQYGDDREVTVIIKTIPDKPLPKTGGIPPLLGAGVLLAFAALVSVGILRR